MAVTGLIFVGFVLFHMYGNLKLFQGKETFDHYAHFLQNDLLYPILPHRGGLYLLRIGLALSLVLHVGSAAHLYLRNRRARGSQYKVKRGVKKSQSYASRTMKVGGVILLLFIIFHILHFTALRINVGGDYSQLSPYERVVTAFDGGSAASIACYLFYLAAMCALALHVRHGVFSALATLGLDRRRREVMFNGIAWFCALALLIGFMAPPTAVLFGLIR